MFASRPRDLTWEWEWRRDEMTRDAEEQTRNEREFESLEKKNDGSLHKNVSLTCSKFWGFKNPHNSRRFRTSHQHNKNFRDHSDFKYRIYALQNTCLPLGRRHFVPPIFSKHRNFLGHARTSNYHRDRTGSARLFQKRWENRRVK